MTRKISVIIPTYNYGRFIADAIKGVLAQTYPIEEIIVIDDGSTDDTAEIVAGFVPQVKYFKQENSGVCAARNNGVKRSSGDYIAFLDADDIWHPEKIAKQIKRFEEDAEIGLVHCGMREFDNESGETVQLHLEGEEGWIADDLLLFEKPAIAGCGGAILISRKAFSESGEFDTNLIVAEDWDFCYRVARKFKVGFVREVLMDYRNHGKNAHSDVAELERSMGAFYKKTFQTDDEKILNLRKRAYGNFHTKLAGSYFFVGDYPKFIKHSFKSVQMSPKNILYFLEFPVRRLKRAFKK